MGSSEVTKLQQHLALLKEEYSKLQSHCAEVERKYTLVAASAGDLSETSFVARLLMTVTSLYGRETYSDIKVKLQDKSLPGHKFVLNARSDDWNEEALKNVNELDWSNLPDDVGAALLKWLYTDVVDLSRGDMFAMQLMKSAANFKLHGLVNKCEQALIACVGVRTCVKFYSAADEIGASALKEHCSGLISAHWDDLTVSTQFPQLNSRRTFTRGQSPVYRRPIQPSREPCPAQINSPVHYAQAYSAQPTRSSPYSAQPTRSSPYSAQHTRSSPYSTQPIRSSPFSDQPTRSLPYSEQPTRSSAYSAQPTPLSISNLYCPLPDQRSQANSLPQIQ